MFGYDPENLTGQQRTIAEESQQQELAARYNGGPYWANDRAQGSGGDFAHHLDETRNAIR